MKRGGVVGVGRSGSWGDGCFRDIEVPQCILVSVLQESNGKLARSVHVHPPHTDRPKRQTSSVGKITPCSTSQMKIALVSITISGFAPQTFPDRMLGIATLHHCFLSLHFLSFTGPRGHSPPALARLEGNCCNSVFVTAEDQVMIIIILANAVTIGVEQWIRVEGVPCFSKYARWCWSYVF